MENRLLTDHPMSLDAMTLRPYLELVRPPNVTTAVGDVLAGYAVAGARWPGSLAWLLAATVCLYAGGIVLNDVFDPDIDRVERPERPLPSGRVTRAPRRRVSAAACSRPGVGLACGGGLAAGLVGGGHGAVHPALRRGGASARPGGPVNMGLCRAGNLMLGVAADASGAALGLAAGAAAPGLHHRGDRGQPRRSARRKSAGRGLRSDILGGLFCWRCCG